MDGCKPIDFQGLICPQSWLGWISHSFIIHIIGWNPSKLWLIISYTEVIKYGYYIDR